MIQVNRIYLIFNRLVTKKFLVDTSDIALFGIYALVGYVVHLFIKQYPIQTFELVFQVGTMLC